MSDEPEVSTRDIFHFLKTKYPQSVLIVPDEQGVSQLYSHGMDADVLALVLYQIADRVVSEHCPMPAKLASLESRKN